MLNAVWCMMMITGIVCGMLGGKTGALSEAAMAGAAQSVELIIAMAGSMMLWSGVMEIMQQSGLTNALAARFARPLRRLFPRTGKKALSAVCLCFCANALGLGNAATPLGLKAIKALQAENPTPETASNAQIVFLVLNSTLVHFLPVALINLRTAAGSARPFAIVVPCIAASFVTMGFGVLAALWVNRR